MSLLLLGVSFVAILIIFIAYARGYRLDLKQKSVTSTGILAISSTPSAAKVYLNQELKGVTNINLSLPPGRYQIEIKKDGYTSWKKEIVLKGELVETVEALLFPTNPSLSPLTNLGIVKTVRLGQTDKILIFSQNDNLEKDGIYVFESSKKPISFLPPLKLIVLKKNLPPETDLAKTEVYFSADLKQAIFEFSLSASYLFSLEEENKQLFEVSNSKEALLSAWEEEKQQQILKILETYPKEIKKIASDSFQIISFSPDETKMLYQAKTQLDLPLVIKPPLIGTNQTKQERSLKKDGLYVYDKKEDKNFLVENWKPKIENSIQWYSDSRHLVINEEKRISIIDYDGTNKQTVYSGPAEDSFFSTTTDGKIVVLANLNPQTNKLPDLYLVGIR